MPIARRSFLRTLAASGAGAAAATQFAGCATTSSPRALTIIDTHTHFYDPTRPGGVPWPNPSDALLYRRVLPADYQALPVPQPVAGTVVVEASQLVEDNQWILDLATRHPFIVGFVGNLRPGEPAFAGNLKRFAAHPLYRGIRVNENVLRPGLARPEFMADFKRLADAGLELDVNGAPTLLPEVTRLAQAIPELRIVINHFANVRIDGRSVPADWQRDLEAAARHPRVFLKVSALVEGAGRAGTTAPRDVDFYRPWLDVAWNAFGADRLIYGSNWPVSARFGDLATVQGIVHDYFSARGREALEKVFAGNARAAYRWVKR